jgi:PAS domain S-box-containing protein
LVQGGVGAVGRLPVFLPGKDADTLEFWGFATALISFPDLLREVGLPRLQERGYGYRLSKTHPDTGQPQIIATSLPDSAVLVDPVEYQLHLPNGHWVLGVAPVNGWRNESRLAVNAAIGSVLSLLLGWLAMQMLQLRSRRERLTVLVAQRTRELSQQVEERLLAQKALVSEEARLAALLETVSDGIHILDANGDLLQFSHSFAAMLGYSDDEIRGLNVMDWDAQFPKNKIIQVVRDLMQVAARFETRQRRKDGTLIDVEVYAKGVEIGGKLYLYNSARDISQRKAAEQALRIAATAFESQQGMTITDAQHNILRVNQAFTEITGYSAEEVVGRNPRVLASGRHDRDFYAAMWASIHCEGSWQGEIWNRRKSGEVFPEWLTVSAVKDDAGQATHYVAEVSNHVEKVERARAPERPVAVHRRGERIQRGNGALRGAVPVWRR